MRIAVVHDWYPDFEQEYSWRDGLAAALRVLSERHEVKFLTCGETEMVMPHPYFPIYFVKPGDGMVNAVNDFKPDVILHWSDMTREHAQSLWMLGKPMAICFAGGEPLSYNTELFDHIFVESEVYRQKFDQAGYSVSIAFGTNTDLFTPEPRQQKVFDALFPATYALWKRHDLLAQATQGLRVATAGYMYPNTRESECYEVMQDNGALVLPHVSADALRALYAASKVVVIPSRSDGGSQRTVLEAMAMNVPVIAVGSDKTTEYLIDSFDLGFVSGSVPYADNDAELIRKGIDYWRAVEPGYVNSREYILSKWTHQHYADALEKELLRLCNQPSQS